MRAAKVIGLGILFSFIGFIMVIVISIMSGRATFETQTSHATGLSAVVGGIIEGLFNPMTWLVIVLGFVAAAWVTRKTSKRTSTS